HQTSKSSSARHLRVLHRHQTLFRQRTDLSPRPHLTVNRRITPLPAIIINNLLSRLLHIEVTNHHWAIVVNHIVHHHLHAHIGHHRKIIEIAISVSPVSKHHERTEQQATKI